MKLKHLSPDIISLIHHVELNESGWWKKAIGQVVKGVLWKTETPKSITELQDALQQDVGINLPVDSLEKLLSTLMSQGVVAKPICDKFRLSEHARLELTKAQQKAKAEQDECTDTFLASCATYTPSLNSKEVWEHFQRSLLHAIQVTGANLFHLLADGRLQRDFDWVHGFLSRFSTEHHDGLYKVLQVFFTPSNSACRNQILRLLTAHFFAEASQLKPETLAAIEGKKTKRTIKVVLDTNFIFSVLQLHDNPGDDSALSLIDIAQRAGKKLDIRFYVLPGTLEEAKRVILHQMNLIDRIKTTTVMSRAALHQPLPSIAKKFFDTASRNPGLSARAFFQPYIDDLKIILQEKGIKVLDAHPTIYNQRQDVVDDVLDEIKREEREIPESKRKGYETHLHDAVLWHAVKDRRPSYSDSPFDVEYWAVSIDWRLISFDRKKRAANASNLPVVLHPSNLIQLVQFWVPRSQQLEDSLVDSFRLPLFFQSFDPEDERATIQVLQALSRFENVDDLPDSTVRSILTNRALRGRLKEADTSNDEIFALVREELLSEHQAALNLLEQTQGKLNATVAFLDTEKASKEKSENALLATQEQLREAEKIAREAEQKIADAERLREAKDQQLSQIEIKSKEAQRELKRLRYFLIAILAPCVLGFTLALTEYFFFEISFGPINKIITAILLGITPLALSCLISPYITIKHEALLSWRIVRIVNWVGKKALLVPGSLALVAIFQGGIWDWVKSVMNWNP
ncbi:hypothetical protein [Aeromonas caviae]|uniref:hypothetical protein n=1 Tax=Aeromonas caviae TaxID=648 RepID=UPI002B463F3D|nr:hypothetical protein [Aeromonas caviae]